MPCSFVLDLGLLNEAPSQLAQVTTLLISVRDVACFNIGPGTDCYTYWDFFVDFLIPFNPVLGYYQTFYNDLASGFKTVGKACLWHIAKDTSTMTGSVKERGLMCVFYSFATNRERIRILLSAGKWNSASCCLIATGCCARKFPHRHEHLSITERNVRCKIGMFSTLLYTALTDLK